MQARPPSSRQRRRANRTRRRRHFTFALPWLAPRGARRRVRRRRSITSLPIAIRRFCAATVPMHRIPHFRGITILRSGHGWARQGALPRGREDLSRAVEHHRAESSPGAVVAALAGFVLVSAMDDELGAALPWLDGVVLGEESMYFKPFSEWADGWRLFCREAGIDPARVAGIQENLSEREKRLPGGTGISASRSRGSTRSMISSNCDMGNSVLAFPFAHFCPIRMARANMTGSGNSTSAPGITTRSTIASLATRKRDPPIQDPLARSSGIVAGERRTATNSSGQGSA